MLIQLFKVVFTVSIGLLFAILIVKSMAEENVN